MRKKIDTELKKRNLRFVFKHVLNCFLYVTFDTMLT